MNFFESNIDNKRDALKALMAKSSRAICGTFEREVVVKSEDVSKIRKMLESRGIQFVGSGPAGKGTSKIWFVKRGLSQL